MSHSYVDTFRQLVPRHLGRAWSEADGIPAAELARLLKPHPFAVPRALRAFYEAVGRCDELMEARNFFWDPDELELDGGYLLFLDEASEAANWGFPVDSLDDIDPIVWQRVNIDPPVWSSEKALFSMFVEDMFDWAFNDDAR